jgi:hypothetical protein
MQNNLQRTLDHTVRFSLFWNQLDRLATPTYLSPSTATGENPVGSLPYSLEPRNLMRAWFPGENLTNSAATLI